MKSRLLLLLRNLRINDSAVSLLVPRVLDTRHVLDTGEGAGHGEDRDTSALEATVKKHQVGAVSNV